MTDIKTRNSKCNNFELLYKVVKESYSHEEALRKLGLRAAGGNHKTIKKYIKLFDINTDHFNKIHVHGLRKREKLIAPTKESILCVDCKFSRPALRRFLIKNKILKYECKGCGIGPFYNNKKLTLHIDHINGIYNDNRIDNLRWLCPNCHSQTENFAGKYRRKNNTKLSA